MPVAVDVRNDRDAHQGSSRETTTVSRVRGSRVLGPILLALATAEAGVRLLKPRKALDPAGAR